MTTQFDVTNAVLKSLGDYDLTAAEKVVLLVYTTYYGYKTPQQKEIAERSGLEIKTVNRAFKT